MKNKYTKKPKQKKKPIDKPTLGDLIERQESAVKSNARRGNDHRDHRARR